MIRNSEVVKRHKVGMAVGDSWYRVANVYSGYTYGHIAAKSQRSALLAARRLFCGYDSTVVVYTGKQIEPVVSNEPVVCSFTKEVNSNASFDCDTAINIIQTNNPDIPEVQLDGIWVALSGLDNKVCKLFISRCNDKKGNIRVMYVIHPNDTYGFWQTVDRSGMLGKLKIYHHTKTI